MADNNSIKPTPWSWVVIAVLPGIAALLAAHPAFPQGSTTGTYWRLGLVAASILIGLLLWLQQRATLPQIAPAFLIALGYVVGLLAIGSLLAAPALLLGVALGWVQVTENSRARTQTSRLVITLGTVLLLLLANRLHLFSTLGSAGGSPTDNTRDLATVLGIMSFNLAANLGPVLLGLPFARRYGIVATLFVLGAQYWWIEIANPTRDLILWHSHNTAALVVLEGWIALFYLVIAPIWVLRASTNSGRLLGLLVAPSAGLVGAEWLRSSLLQNTPLAYTTGAWISRGSIILETLIVLALAALLYQLTEGSHQGKQQPDLAHRAEELIPA